MSKDIFIKTYDGSGQFMNLPANSYWLLREETILSYLAQRDVQVPKVYLKNIESQSITLENVGTSFDALFIKSNDSNARTLFQCLNDACKELLKIFELGVLHLDIAARNITKKNGDEARVYILDFSHAVCNNYVLEKPIPLLPKPQIQHPEFVNALKEDWIRFFEKNNQEIPDLDTNFDVNDQQFSNYWTNDLAIQNLTHSYSVLCHGLGGLFLEISESRILSSEDKIFLINLGQNLRFNEEISAKANLQQTLIELQSYEPNENNMYQGGTQIPVVQYQTTPGATTINPPIIDPQIITPKENVVAKTASTATKNSELIPKGGQSSPLPIINIANQIRTKSFGTLAFSWMILIANFFWLDFIISETEIKLPDFIIYIVLGIAVLVILNMVIALLNRNLLVKLKSDIPALIILMQMSLTIFSGTKTQGHFIVWLPSAICYITVVALMFRNKN